MIKLLEITGMFFPRGELKNWFNFTFCEDIAAQATVVSLVLYFLNFVLFSLDARVSFTQQPPSPT
jgi:hypothetical protein